MLGPGEAPPEEDLIAEVRRNVPESVPVRLIEESGVELEF